MYCSGVAGCGGFQWGEVNGGSRCIKCFMGGGNMVLVTHLAHKALVFRGSTGVVQTFP